MSLFEIVGIVLAVWALVVSALGIRGHDFPRSPKLERLVAAISVVLVIAAIGTAIYSSSVEHEEKEKAKEAAASIPVRP